MIQASEAGALISYAMQLAPRDRSSKLAEGPVLAIQNGWEFGMLIRLYHAFSPKKVLEIGTYTGGTLYHWLQESTQGAVIVSVDSYQPGPEYSGEPFDNRKLYPSWTPRDVECVSIEGDSQDDAIVARIAAYAPFEWVFIDGGHMYEDVKADWDTYKPLVALGGVVVFHDILPSPLPHIEVSRLWEEIRRQGYVTQEIVADPQGEEFGLGVVYCLCRASS